MPSNHDPAAARFVTEDLARFWAVFPHLDAPDAAERFEQGYLQAGTPGLHAFTELRIGNAEQLVQTVRARRAYYASLQPQTAQLARVIPTIRASFRALADLYQQAVFPDTTFLVGRLNSGGTIAREGTLIGTEFFTRAPDSPTGELTPWERAVTRSLHDLPGIVAHELIHVQQYASVPEEQWPDPSQTLLAQCLREGVAELLGEVISGQAVTPDAGGYGQRHEAALWARFQAEMDGEDVSGWLYQGNSTGEEPADLRYFVGAQVCRAYLEQHGNGPEAVRDVIERSVTDPLGFLMDSGYAPLS